MIIKKNEYYFILPNGLGDSLIMRCIHHQLEERYGGIITYVIKESHSIVFKSTNINYYCLSTLYSKEDLYKLANESPWPLNGKLFVAHPTYHNKGILDKRFLQHEISFLEMYSIFFDIKIDNIQWVFDYKSPSRTLSNKVKKICGTDKLDDVVLFAPEMNSGAEYEKIQPGWSYQMYSQIKEKYQYVIYNSVSRAHNQMMNEELTLDEIAEVGMNCKCVITARSGLADILLGNVKSMIIMYPNIGYYDLFNMRAIWNINYDNVREHIFHIGDYFRSNNYTRVCIYGFGEGGQRIKYSLEKEKISIDFAVDKKAVSNDIKIFRPSMKLPKADVMVVCVKNTKEEIVHTLKYEFSGEIVEMREVMESMLTPKFDII